MVADDELDAFVDDWARRLAQGPPLALAMTKTLLDNAMSVTMAQALEDEARCQTINFATEDTAEAMRAFAEKRDAEVRGSLRARLLLLAALPASCACAGIRRTRGGGPDQRCSRPRGPQDRGTW